MSFQIGRLEASSPHLLADLIELISLLNPDGRSAYRPDDIASVIMGQPNFAKFAPRDLEDSIEQAWLHLEYRLGAFGVAYPFVMRREALANRPQLQPMQRIYCFLLACSRLRSFDSALRSVRAVDFSKLSREALTVLMPKGADVRIFDANSEDRRVVFSNDLRVALSRLGERLAASHVNEELCKKYEPQGDAGIDLVAVVNWDDNAPGKHVILGQCAACETDWPDKRLEAHPLAFRGLFTFLSDPVNACFIPLLYRETNGHWIMESEASGCLLIDRLRLTLLLKRRGRLAEIVLAPWFIEFESQLQQIALRSVAVVA